MTVPQEPQLEKIKVETKRVNKLKPNIPIGNITELNKQEWNESVIKLLLSYGARRELDKKDK